MVWLFDYEYMTVVFYKNIQYIENILFFFIVGSTFIMYIYFYSNHPNVYSLLVYSSLFRYVSLITYISMFESISG